MAENAVPKLHELSQVGRSKSWIHKTDLRVRQELSLVVLRGAHVLAAGDQTFCSPCGRLLLQNPSEVRRYKVLHLGGSSCQTFFKTDRYKEPTRYCQTSCQIPPFTGVLRVHYVPQEGVPDLPGQGQGLLQRQQAVPSLQGGGEAAAFPPKLGISCRRRGAVVPVRHWKNPPRFLSTCTYFTLCSTVPQPIHSCCNVT
jgi:hypothetical protein